MLDKTNSRSCTLDAFAFITGIPTEELIEEMGDDGAEEGIATQQLVVPLLRRGWTMTPVERTPRRQNPETWEVKHVFGDQHAEDRFDVLLSHFDGVLMGHWERGLTHAIAWKDGTMHDSAPRAYRFVPEIFWVVRKCV